MTEFKLLSLVFTGPSWVNLPANSFQHSFQNLMPHWPACDASSPLTLTLLSAWNANGCPVLWLRNALRPPNQLQCHLLHEAFLVPRAELLPELNGEAGCSGDVSCLESQVHCPLLLPAYGPLIDTGSVCGVQGRPQKSVPMGHPPPVLRAILPSPPGPKALGLGGSEREQRTH